jgi:NADP-dependent 3-hydroxy acid dehydrogenase YdfG
MKRFEDKVVLVSGASGGIGEALAREFCRVGAKVVLLARRRDKLESVADALRRAGGDALPVVCDVTSEGQVRQAVGETLARFERIDVVVANAGFGVGGPAVRLKVDDYRRQFETNVFGVLNVTYAALPALGRSRGQLVIIGSVNSHVALPNTAPYCMSKFAARAFAQAMRAELAPYGIGVTHISPGFISTEIRRVDNRGVLHPDAKDPIPSWLQMAPETAAKRIVAAAAGNRHDRVLTRTGVVAVRAERWAPGLMRWVKRRMARSTAWKMDDPQPKDGTAA